MRQRKAEVQAAASDRGVGAVCHKDVERGEILLLLPRIGRIGKAAKYVMQPCVRSVAEPAYHQSSACRK